MNFCPNCGTQQNGSAKFCPSCGSSIKEETAVRSELETSASLEPEKKGNLKKVISKKWLIIMIGLLILIGGTSTFALTILKSPKALYFMAEAKSYKQNKSEWDAIYGDSLKYQEMLLENPSSNQLKITGNVEVPDIAMSPEVAMIQEVLSQAAIMLNSEQDPKNNIAKINMGLQMDGTNTIDIDLYQSPKLIGAKVPVLYDKVFYLKTDQFGQLMRNIDSYYDGPEKLDLNNLNWNELRLTDKEIASLSKRYGKFLYEALDDENFTLKKGVSYEHNGETMKLKQITLHLTPKETQTFVKKWIDQIIQDQELHTIIANRVVLVANSGQLDQYDETLTDPKKVKENIRDSLKDLKEELAEVSFSKGFKSVIFIDKNEQIVDRTTEFSIGDDYEKVTFQISSKNVPYEKNNRYKEWKIEIQPEDDQESKLVFEVNNEIQSEKENRIEDMNISFLFKEYGDIQVDLGLNLQSEFTEFSDGYLDVKRDFQLMIDGTEFYSPFSAISGTITQKGETNLKNKTSNQTLNFVLTIAEGNESGKIKLGFNSKSTINTDLKIQPINTKDGINIAEITETDLYDMQDEIGSRLLELVDELGIYEEMSYGNDYSLFGNSYDNLAYQDDYDYTDYEEYYYEYADYGYDEDAYIDEYSVYDRSCATCHGQNLDGGVGPSLYDIGSWLSPDEVYSIIINGQGAMPGGLLDDQTAIAIANWLTTEYY